MTREERRLKRCRRITFWLAVALLAAAVGAAAAVLTTPMPTPAEPVPEKPAEPTPTVTRLAVEPTPPVEEIEAADPTDKPVPPATEEEARALARTVWGEARGCSVTEQAAVVWCVLNRVDSAEPYYPDDIIGVVSQPKQFSGYDPNHPVDSDILALVWDVLERWQAEKSGAEDVGRVLPADYLWFRGDGKANHFRDAYKGGETWDWSLDSPYNTKGE